MRNNATHSHCNAQEGRETASSAVPPAFVTAPARRSSAASRSDARPLSPPPSRLASFRRCAPRDRTCSSALSLALPCCALCKAGRTGRLQGEDRSAGRTETETLWATEGKGGGAHSRETTEDSRQTTGARAAGAEADTLGPLCIQTTRLRTSRRDAEEEEPLRHCANGASDADSLGACALL